MLVPTPNPLRQASTNTSLLQIPSPATRRSRQQNWQTRDRVYAERAADLSMELQLQKGQPWSKVRCYSSRFRCALLQQRIVDQHRTDLVEDLLL